MASTSTPNMSLIIPGVGTEPGPQYATDINSSLSIIDQHNHSLGSGVQITPSGLNINSNLTLNNNSLFNIGALTLTTQASTPVNGSIFMSGNDLHYIDGNGINVAITSGGVVNATSSGISSGTASAQFVAGVLVVNAATNTPANIQAASILFGNNTAGTNYVTLSPPNVTSAYRLFLPTIPAQTNVMTLDTSGNMGSITYDNVAQNMTFVGANAIATTMTAPGAQTIATTMGTTGADIIGQEMSPTGANAVANTRTRAIGSVGTIPVGGVGITGGVSGTFVNPTSNVTVPGLGLTLTTTGRPVYVSLQAAVGTANSFIGQSNTSNTARVIVAAAPSGNFWALGIPGTGSGISGYSTCPFSFIDTTAAAGNNSYAVFVQDSTNNTIYISHMSLVVYEI